MNVTDEMLMAYVDGELDDETSARIVRLFAEDPELAGRMALFETTRRLAMAAFQPELSRSAPDRLKAAVEAAVASSRNPPARRISDRRIVFALPLAASVAVAFALAGYWYGLQSSATGELLGQSELARALGDLPAGRSAVVRFGADDARVTTVAAYRVPDGTCRMFDVAMPSARNGVRGVGCSRLGQAWTIDLTVSATPGDAFSPASTGLIESIDAYLDALEAEPLSVDQDTARQRE